MRHSTGTLTCVSEELRILIADDQPLMSGALRALVASAPGMT